MAKITVDLYNCDICGKKITEGESSVISLLAHTKKLVQQGELNALPERIYYHHDGCGMGTNPLPIEDGFNSLFFHLCDCCMERLMQSFYRKDKSNKEKHKPLVKVLDQIRNRGI